VGVGLSGEGGWRWWCRFNASVSTREERRRDEALSEYEIESSSSYWLHGKKALHGAMVTWAIGEVAPERGKGEDDTCWADVNLTEP
jgi:hypothetical protein